jgi:tetratricopeptide (TPR) repeat protein
LNTQENSELEALLLEVKKLIRSSEFSVAAERLNHVVAKSPEHIDAHYLLAVCQRKLDQHTQALGTLNLLKSIDTLHTHALQECGYNYQALGQNIDAINAFEEAVKINPALHGAWNALAQMPDYVGRENAQRQLQWLQSLPPELVSASSLIHQKKLHKAEVLCRQYLKREPHHPEAMRLLAELGSEFNILDDAEFLLEKCLEFRPDFLRARLDYVSVLHRRQKFSEALTQSKILFDSEPSNIGFEISVGNCLQATGDFDGAIQAYKNVITKYSTNPSVHLALGHALKTIGKTPEAIEAYKAANSAQADYGDAYWSLANLKTYEFSDSEINTMLKHEQSVTTNELDRVQIRFALGKAYEDRNEYVESFKYYQLGNQLKSNELSYDAKSVKAGLAFQKEKLDAAFFAERQSFGHDDAAPIFIVGLPRAGSTLLEQILASHSQVDGTMELANVISMAHRFNGRQTVHDAPRYPSVLADLPEQGFKNLGQQYIEDTKGHRQGGAYFIDKMPNNFRHIAMIHLMLPNAKIIDARREPMACCFSGYKQLFAEGQEFSYDMDDIGEYYLEYVDVMNHWDKVLPGRILKVQHEEVLDDLEGQVHRILDYCGLPFEQTCVEFHKNKRAVRTPSSEQVRQPIYKSGVDLWRNYEEFLEPLKSALAPINDNV